jgi:hypothetical protein
MEAYRRNTNTDPGPDVFERALERERISHFTARYGVEWTDISSREDREHWIAGSSLRVLDVRTQDVIAERIGYMIDRGQGSQAGFRSPWRFAQYNACPSLQPSISDRPDQSLRSRAFVLKVLKTHSGE